LGHYPTGGWDASATSLGLISPDRGADWRQPGGWAYTILPFMDEKNTHETVDTVLRNSLPVPVFACPTRRASSIAPSGVIMTDYAGNRGAWASPTPTVATNTDRNTTFGAPSTTVTIPLDDATEAATAATLLNTVQLTFGSGTSAATGGIIFIGSSLLPARIRDGTSNTYLFAEKYVPQSAYTTGTTGYENPAYAGDSPDTLRGGHRPPLSDATPWTGTPAGAFGGPHSGIFNAAFCDGSVRPIDLGITAQIHFLLSAREDRLPVEAP
jgi:prepilin-type processing-associated H-X9-DG protein